MIYTTTNGYVVERHEDRSISISAEDDRWSWRVNEGYGDALEEFFRHERDELPSHFQAKRGEAWLVTLTNQQTHFAYVDDDGDFRLILHSGSWDYYSLDDPRIVSATKLGGPNYG